MRRALLLLCLSLLAGCGTPSTAAPKPTARPKAVHPREPGARWTHAPAMTINIHHKYYAVVNTTDGTFTIQLLPLIAPVTVNNFVFLARHHYYDHNKFHRIIATFMIQTGDPTGTGFGGPGYTFKDEKVTTRYTPGTVAMANTGQPNTNGSQFFIVTGPDASSLSKTYTIFGRVIRGMKVVDKIANTPVTTSPSGEMSQPLTDVYMKTVRIREVR